jgi:hypothetical protein
MSIESQLAAIQQHRESDRMTMPYHTKENFLKAVGEAAGDKDVPLLCELNDHAEAFYKNGELNGIQCMINQLIRLIEWIEQ